MNAKKIRSFAVVGGGTAGWSAAAILANTYGAKDVTVTLIESPTHAPVGVGEATVPAIANVHNELGIDEVEFFRRTNATFKLGIRFDEWANKGTSFFHPFSDFGVKIGPASFASCWFRAGVDAATPDLTEFSLCSALAKSGRFSIPDNGSENPLAWYGYAYHFDATLYAQFLREYSQKRGVEWVSATVEGVSQNPQSGMIESLQLDNGRRIKADFFVDCTGFSSRLLNGVYHEPFEDWSKWLPCDRAWVMQTEQGSTIPPFTVSKALSNGWRWKIPLRNRVGNGYVFSSAYQSEEDALVEFEKEVTENRTTEPRLIRFSTGMRPRFWVSNCAAVGLSSGFLEPLESTSISLMHTGIAKIIAHLPDLHLLDEARARANELNRMEFERVRDFIILHYISSKRSDSLFWRDRRVSSVPTELQNKIAAFQSTGDILSFEMESFRDPSWHAMYAGFGYLPQNFSPDVVNVPPELVQRAMDGCKRAIDAAVIHAPEHKAFLQEMLGSEI